VPKSPLLFLRRRMINMRIKEKKKKGAINKMFKIQKRDGRVVQFDENKIENAVYKAFIACHMLENAQLSAAKVKDVVLNIIDKRFRNNSIIHVEQVQDIVEDVLIKSEFSNVAKAYIRYRHERALAREKFFENQSKFIKTIEKITFQESEENNLKRENANVDGNTAMGMMLQYGSNLSKEFGKTHLLKEEHYKAHESGDIHIHDLDFYASGGTTTCCQIDLGKLFSNGFSTGHGHLREPQSIMSYAALTAIAIQANQNDQHGGQSINLFDYYLAPGVLKSFKKRLKNNIEKVIDIKMIEMLCHSRDSSRDSEKLTDEIMDILNVTTIEFSEIDKEKFANILKDKLSFLSLANDSLYSIADYIIDKTLKETNRETYQAMESLVHNLNTMNSRAGSQTPFSSINFGTDTSPEGRMVSKNLLLAVDAGLGKGETAIFPILIFKVKEGVNYNPGDPNYDLFQLACKVSAKRLFPNFSFLDAPFNLQYYDENNPHTEASYMGCRTRVMSNVNGPEIATSRGNLSFTTINLPRLGIKHGITYKAIPDIDGFFDELGELMDLVKDQLLERFKYQARKKVKNFPFLMGEGVWFDSEKLDYNDTLEDVLKHGTLTIGFIGLAECLVGLIGEHHGESEIAQQLGLEIIQYMRSKVDKYTEEYGLNFSLIATPAEGLAGRFTKLDKEIYGEIEGITDREYYTNSFHVPVYYPITIHEKIKIEAPYHELTNGGHITYVELDGDPLQNLEAFEKIVRFMKESGIGYGSINHPVDRDPVCGYTGIINDECPNCGRKEDGIKFERIRRITGYLVGTLDRFNDAKKAEVRDRVKHFSCTCK